MSYETDAARGAAATVGAIFRSTREIQRLSQQQVAALTDGQRWPISRSAISDIERGRNLPGLEALASLSRVLHIDPAEVLERVDLAMTAPIHPTAASLEDLKQQAERSFLDGDYRTALCTYDVMLERLALDQPADERRQKELHARIEINRAVALRHCSALRAAHASAERAVELAVGFPEVHARAYIALASVLSNEGMVTLAQVAAREAVSLAAAAGADVQAQALNQQGNVLYRAGKFEDAREVFLNARKCFAGTDDRNHQIKVEGNIGACLMSLGRVLHAQAQFAKAIELSRKYKNPAAEAMWLVTLGKLMLAGARLDDAERHAVDALRIAQPREYTLTVFRALWLRHLVAKRQHPDDPDARRLALLHKLYRRLRGHEGLTEIQEFKEAVILTARGQSGGSRV